MIRYMEGSRCLRLSMVQWIVHYEGRENIPARTERRGTQKDSEIETAEMCDRCGEYDISQK